MWFCFSYVFLFDQESLLLLFGDSEYNRSTRGLAPRSPTRLNHATHDHLPPTGISQVGI